MVEIAPKGELLAVAYDLVGVTARVAQLPIASRQHTITALESCSVRRHAR